MRGPLPQAVLLPCSLLRYNRDEADTKTVLFSAELLVRRVQKHGDFAWKHQHVFLSETLAGEAVGLEALDERYYRIYFAKFPIGRFDSHERQVEPLAPPAAKPSGP